MKGGDRGYLVLEVGLGHGEEELVLVGGGGHGQQRGCWDQRRRRPLPHQRRELQHLRAPAGGGLAWVGFGLGAELRNTSGTQAGSAHKNHGAATRGPSVAFLLPV
jgi:hypothetical protein